MLWEYAKLGDKIKRVSYRSNARFGLPTFDLLQIANLARLTAESPNEPLLAELRTLEKKMGLVLTLVSQSLGVSDGPGSD